MTNVRLPVLRSEALSARAPHSGKRTARKPRAKNAWTRKRLDYDALEAAKFLVASLLYKQYAAKDGKRQYTKELRVAILPWSKTGYMDIRVYLNGKSTGQGVLVHIHRWKELLGNLIAADRELDRFVKQGIIDPLETEPTKFEVPVKA